MTDANTKEANPKITKKGLLVLKTLMHSKKNKLSGANIISQSELYSGTTYPILIRFEKAKWLTSAWEDGDPKELGRPLNKYYSITPLGKEKARSKIDEIQNKINKLNEYITA